MVERFDQNNANYDLVSSFLHEHVLFAQIYIPETRRGRHLRLFLLDYPVSLIGPISVLVVSTIQLVTCLQASPLRIT